ncbi:MAG: glycosyltransferase family 2 protein [Chloroflexi bacterium]|nr:glycosyltransferase family 2 protein [Chloroflexota bacterium]
MPRVSVIIPNWNGAPYLAVCLDSLRRQTYNDFQVVVVDNGSHDQSLALLREFPEVQVIPLPSNRFFAGAVNQGIRCSQGEVVVLLNNDTEAEPTWLEELVRGLEAHSEAGMAASKLLLFRQRGILHSAGDFYGRDGVPGNRGVWQRDNGQYDIVEEVFGPCGGAAAYQRRMLDDIGLFDEDFKGYCEDVDLAFRGQLRGYRCAFIPSARVYHHLSATGGGPLASFLCGQNFINVIVKDMPSPLLRRYWRDILGAQLGYVSQSLRHWREPAARARLRGQLAALTMLPRMLVKRQHIQAQRRVSIEEIESRLSAPGNGPRP